MLLSVIVPMYNSLKYIDGMFESICLRQKKDIEIIIIDDGSTDDSLKKCQEWALLYPEIKLIHNLNYGVSYSRNCGIEIAQGDFLMFLDSDDCFNENWYKKLYSALIENPDCDMMIFSKNVCERTYCKKEIIEAIVGIPSELSNCYLSAPWSKVFNRRFLNENNIKFNVEIIHGEDALFNLKAIICSNNYKIINECIYLYRINQNSSTHKYNKKYLKSNRLYMEELSSILSNVQEASKEEVEEYKRYSFQNSIYIYVGKVSKIGVFKDKINATRQFYADAYYLQQLKELKMSNKLTIKKRVVYFMVKIKQFFLIEMLVNLIKCVRRDERDVWYKV